MSAPFGFADFRVAQKPQERPSNSPSQSSNQTASRDVEAPGEAAETTVAKIDERRRQEEADRANRLYDLPMDTDGPRFDEPGTDRFAPEIADDLAVNLKTAKALMLTVDESGGESVQPLAH